MGRNREWLGAGPRAWLTLAGMVLAGFLMAVAGLVRLSVPAWAGDTGWSDFAAPEAPPESPPESTASVRFAPPAPVPEDPAPLTPGAIAPNKDANGTPSSGLLTDFSNAMGANKGSDGDAPVIPTVNAFTTKADARLIASLPDAMHNSDLQAGLDPDGHPWMHDRSLAPIWQDGQDAFLVQGDGGHWRAGTSDDATGGGGFGLRHLLLGDRWMIGANGFVDDSWTASEARCSLGAEFGSGPLGLGVNFYQPYASGQVDGMSQSAASGRDVTLRLQVPYIPSATASFKNSQWQSGAIWNTGPVTTPALENAFGLGFKPLPYLSLDGTYARSDATSPSSMALMMKVNFKLDGVVSMSDMPLVDSVAYRFTSMTSHLLDLIGREDLVPLIQR
jgi:hypothetical protein